MEHLVGFTHKIVISGSILCFSLALVLAGLSAFAATPDTAAVAPSTSNCGRNAEGLLTCVTSLGYGTPSTPGVVIARVLTVFFGFLGLIFLLLTIYAGFQWMTAMGETDKVKKAKETLRNSVIGLGLIIAAEMISYWVLAQLTSVISKP